MDKKTSIVLSTLNARYTHASLGLRYLRANLGYLREDSIIDEFIIGQKHNEIVEKLLAYQPSIITLGVYIWNIDDTTRVVGLLKTIAPEIVIIIGGPEVSFEHNQQRICQLADYIITGWGDITLRKLIHAILHGPKPVMKIHTGEQPPLSEIVLPYREYSDEDLKNRTLYVEASRGCPFKCEFCLSALDKTAWAFDTDLFLNEMAILYKRGARQFKFVDRTFNLNIKTSLKIMQFFLDRWQDDDPIYAHFELVPDHLPDALKSTIAQFPMGALQFEIGIQTFNPQVQQLISRQQNNNKAVDNLRWLHTHSKAHMHVDLIAGLPAETMDSFSHGFNQLVNLGPHEIQLGILKRLRGTPIIRHTYAFDLKFSPDAPYEILKNSTIDFNTMQRISRFARYWDLIANSGKFTQTLPILLEINAFESFMVFADWLYATTGKTHQIALERLFDLLHTYLTVNKLYDVNTIETLLLNDYSKIGAKGKLAFMQRGLSLNTAQRPSINKQLIKKSIPPRQQMHIK